MIGGQVIARCLDEQYGIDAAQVAYRVNRLLFDELAVATGCADDARSPVG